jgi:hypothetical protein
METKLIVHLDRLSEKDRLEYQKLRDGFATPGWHASRHRLLQTVQQMLSIVQQFVMQGNKDDAKRGLVSGIYWTENGIAVNVLYLSRFLSKSKSSINGGFQALGYGTLPIGGDITADLAGYLPFGSRKFSSIRHWTVRRLISDQPKSVPLPDVMPKEERPLCEMVKNLLQDQGRGESLFGTDTGDGVDWFPQDPEFDITDDQ